MIDRRTKVIALRTIERRMQELRERLVAHERKDAEQAFADWMVTQEREAREAKEELLDLQLAKNVLERL